MATVIERPRKDGRIAYTIRASNGYGTDGKRKRPTKTWVPDAAWSEKRIKKELERQIVLFEEEVAAGMSQDGSIKFQAFTERFFVEYADLQLKPRTVWSYKVRMKRVYQAIGHIRLRDLKTGHLNALYANLQEPGIRADKKYTTRINLLSAIQNSGQTREAFAALAGVSRGALRAATEGQRVSPETSAAISAALGFKMSEIFRQEQSDKPLSSSSIQSYHLTISSILAKAVKWGYISFNPAVNAELPKMRRKEAAFLDDEDIRRLLILLRAEPIKYQMMITLDLFSGLRRGELLGLRWCDVDFDSETITIVQAASYVKGRGVFDDTPKNETSARPIKLSRMVFAMLRDYKSWQDEQRVNCGDQWKDDGGRVFTSDDGGRIHPDSLTKWFEAFIRRHDFPDVHLHSLRHTAASIMIADGIHIVTVSKRLGHAQVSTTSDIYAHMIKAADEKAAQVADKYADVLDTPQCDVVYLKKA